MATSNNTAVIFGGSGFIGRHLSAALGRRGMTVIAADTRPLDPAIDGVRSVVCDVRHPIPLDLVPAEFGGRADVVYNLAAVHRTPDHPDRDYYDTNVWGALRITAYCRATAAKRLHFTSSISVYGADEAAKTEADAPRPETPYGVSKYQAEIIHQTWQAEDATRRLIIARPAVVFGTGERGNFTRLARALRRRMFMFPGRRDTVKACGYVGELVGSLEFAQALDRPTFLYNFCYPRAYTIEDICEALHRVGGLPRPWGTLPYRLLRSTATPFEWLARLGLKTGIHRARIDKLVRSTHIRPTALLDAGYTFDTDLDTGLASWRDASGGRFE